MIAPNQLVGNRYRIVRPLGGGAMKQVYLAQDTRLANRPCALAEMIDSFANPDAQRQATEAFQREADILAGLSHEHIVRVYDRFSEANRHYLVMEYVQGKTLEDTIRAAGGRLGQRAATDIALQILDAFEYLHGHNPAIIYRDLKPSNVVVMPNGRVKLIDFGIARLFQPQTRGTLIGTPGYAAPEQYKGMAEPCSDLYALGAVIHFMLTGRDPSSEVPFSFPPLASLLAGVSAALSSLVDEALAQGVGQRPASAAEFRRRLIRSAGSSATGSSAPTHPITPGTMVCPQCNRDIPSDSSLCPYCGSSLLGKSGSWTIDSEAATARFGGATAAVRKKRRRWPLVASGLMILAGAAFGGTYYYQKVYLPQQREIAAAQAKAQQEEQAAAAEQARRESEQKTAAEHQKRLRGQLAEALRALRSAREGGAKEKELREKAIALALQINPAPAVPDDAEQEIARGESELKVAATAADYRAAASALRKGLKMVPWVAAGYMDLAGAEEKAGDYAGAIASFKYYSLANPQASDAAEVQSKIADVEQLQLKAQQAAEEQRKLALLRKQQEDAERAKQEAEAAAQKAAEEQQEAEERAKQEAGERYRNSDEYFIKSLDGATYKLGTDPCYSNTATIHGNQIFVDVCLQMGPRCGAEPDPRGWARGCHPYASSSTPADPVPIIGRQFSYPMDDGHVPSYPTICEYCFHSSRCVWVGSISENRIVIKLTVDGTYVGHAYDRCHATWEEFERIR
jgi:Protein kinase domain